MVAREEAAVDPRQRVEQREHDRPGTARRRRTGWGRACVRRCVDLEVGHQPQGADQPAEVPVGLGAVGADVGVIGAPQPDRVDLDQPAHQHEHRGDEHEQAERAQRVAGPQRRADDVVLACGPARGTGSGAGLMIIARCTAISAASSAGMMNTCTMYSRDSKGVEPGKRRPTARWRTGRRSAGSTSRRPRRSRGPSRRAGRRAASSRRSPRGSRAASIVTPIR